MAVMRAAVTKVGRAEEERKERYRGAVGGALCKRRCKTRRMRASTGQEKEWPVRAWPIFSPLTAFFWLVKIKLAKVARRMSAREAMEALKTRTPANGEFDVAEAEGFTERIGGGSLSIFTRAIEVEKSNVRHVDDSMLKGGRM